MFCVIFKKKEYLVNMRQAINLLIVSSESPYINLGAKNLASGIFIF